MLIGLFAYYAYWRRVRGKKPGPTSPLVVVSPERYRQVRIGGLVFFALVFLLMLTISPFLTVVAAFAPAWVMGDVVTAQEHGNPRRVIKLLAAAYLVVVVAQTGETWFSPTPLSEVTIETRDSTIEGALIVARGDTWFVTSAARTFESVQADRIVTATVTSPEPEESRPTIPLWDWIG